MKILYGVQGTGNGHITRARAMAVELGKAGAEVDYLFSGRPRERLFDMEAFGDFQHRDGLTFAVRNGRIHLLDTLRGCRPVNFIRDVRQLAIERYDMILSDYEPITAWAGQLRRRPVIGLGHQYAFRHAIPQHRSSPGQRWVMKFFAPASTTLGLHWHHFNQPILPPIAPVDNHRADPERGLILVYLPFESPAAIAGLLRGFTDRHHFRVYHPDITDATAVSCGGPAIRWHRPCRDGFQTDLSRCEGVICNAGFELASEALQLGKKLLVKPVAGQPEQYSNALALDLLGYGHTMAELDAGKITRWLASACGTRIVYPNVAAAICAWLIAGAREPIGDLAARLWEQTELPDLTPATRTDINLPELATTPRGIHHG
ncbi:MAG: MJ1255/VC2487 family glycosyltransferase [Porticoccaceae bacterium]|jgi:uncharacterized protein (TIGR00661 family)